MSVKTYCKGVNETIAHIPKSSCAPWPQSRSPKSKPWTPQKPKQPLKKTPTQEAPFILTQPSELELFSTNIYHTPDIVPEQRQNPSIPYINTPDLPREAQEMNLPTHPEIPPCQILGKPAAYASSSRFLKRGYQPNKLEEGCSTK